jgi:hypothetical protein
MTKMIERRQVSKDSQKELKQGTQRVRRGLSLVDLRLTIPQVGLLAVLPDEHKPGLLLQGHRAQVAKHLTDKGYAKHVGYFGDAESFVRTEVGEAASVEWTLRVSGTENGSGSRR